MRRQILAVVLLYITAMLGAACDRHQSGNGSQAADTSGPRAPQQVALAEVRKQYRTILLRRDHGNEPPDRPPAELFQLVHYPSPAGNLAAYLSTHPRDASRHPAIIWLSGGFSNSIGSFYWEPAPRDNDQSARAFREAGILMMYPSLRGGNDNPGSREGSMAKWTMCLLPLTIWHASPGSIPIGSTSAVTAPAAHWPCCGGVLRSIPRGLQLRPRQRCPTLWLQRSSI